MATENDGWPLSQDNSREPWSETSISFLFSNLFSLFLSWFETKKKEFSRRRPVSIKCRQTHRPYRTEGANVLDDQQTHSLLCLSFILYQYVCAINPSRLVVVPVWNVSLDRRHCYQWRPSVANNSTTTSRSSVLLVEIFFFVVRFSPYNRNCHFSCCFMSLSV